jgi:hypothetical protein
MCYLYRVRHYPSASAAGLYDPPPPQYDIVRALGKKCWDNLRKVTWRRHVMTPKKTGPGENMPIGQEGDHCRPTWVFVSHMVTFKWRRCVVFPCKIILIFFVAEAWDEMSVQLFLGHAALGVANDPPRTSGRFSSMSDPSLPTSMADVCTVLGHRRMLYKIWRRGGSVVAQLILMQHSLVRIRPSP